MNVWKLATVNAEGAPSTQSDLADKVPGRRLLDGKDEADGHAQEVNRAHDNLGVRGKSQPRRDGSGEDDRRHGEKYYSADDVRINIYFDLVSIHIGMPGYEHTLPVSL